jgi:cleavage stimulation factor subunit 3
MADDEAEATFFQAQSLSTESQAPAEEEAENSDSDDYDPSQALGDQYSTSFPDPQETENGPTDTSALDEMDESVPNPALTSDVEAEALDPSQNPPPTESQTSTPVPPSGETAQPKTRTIGGFEVDEDEDDEGDADYEPPAVLEDEDDIPVRMSEDPSSGNANQNTSLDVSIQQAEQGPASGPDLSNSSYSPAHVSNIDPSFVPGQTHWAAQDLQPDMQNSIAPTPVPDSPSAQGRLAHDRVGILEDRIEEDPRGDIPAWLELIAEHRSRGRLDSARETYERFLKVFPMAVSFIFVFLCRLPDC